MTDVEIATTVLLVAALLFLAMGISFFFRTFLRLRETFPVVFNDLTTTYLVDTYVWDPLVPSTVRREYFLHFGCGVIFGCAFTALFVLDERPVPAVLFGAISAFGVIATLIRWIKYRDRI
jgi:hypothetical protein